jgi:hypothetical protein
MIHGANMEICAMIPLNVFYSFFFSSGIGSALIPCYYVLVLPKVLAEKMYSYGLLRGID